MGAYRRLLVSLLVPLSLFAQWDDSDRAVLSTINARLSTLSSIANALNANVSGSLASDVVTIRDHANSIQYNSTEIRDSLYGIQGYIKFHYNRDNLLVQDTNLYEKADQAVDQLGSLNAKFDTFLDFYSNNLYSSSLDPWVYTNTIFFTDPYIYLGYAGQSIGPRYRESVRALLGLGSHVPDSQIDGLVTYFRYFSSSRWHYFDALQYINPDVDMSQEANDEVTKYIDFLDSITLQQPHRQLGFLGHAYFEQYGTKDIKQAVNAISNVVASPVVDRYNSVVLDPKQTFENNGTQSGFSSVMSGVVSGLANSAMSLSMVDTNDLPRPDTNAINKIANDDIKDVMDTAQANGTRLGDELIGSIQASVGSFDTVVSESLQVPSGTPKLTLGYITMDSSYKTYDIAFPDRSEHLAQVFRWAVGVVDFVISVVGAFMIYNRALDQIRPPAGR